MIIYSNGLAIEAIKVRDISEGVSICYAQSKLILVHGVIVIETVGVLGIEEGMIQSKRDKDEFIHKLKI